MIPAFLQSLAATVRDLVRTGKAVHVTEQTAAECDLLAGLPWNKAPMLVLSERVTAPREHEVTARRLTPADIALGWLLCSRARGRELSNMSSVREAWTEKGASMGKRLEKALTAHAICKGWVVALLCLLMACAAIEPGPVKFGWSGDLAKPHGSECVGKTQCDYYWCPTPCPDAGSTQNADGGAKE